MSRRSFLARLALAMIPLSAPLEVAAEQIDLAALQQQVFEVETAFAKSMADRDHVAFARFLADEAIFVGSTRTFRGKGEVAEGWKPFFAGSEAPFSWSPEQVQVLDSGSLALSSGPVFGPQGERIGTFNSIWQRTSDGHWLVVFDKGCPYCEEQ